MKQTIPVKSTASNTIFNNGFVKYLQTRQLEIKVAVAIGIALYVLLRILFPLPGFFNDSYSYIIWATLNEKVAYRPLGYSNFLKLLRDFSTATSFTVIIQYLLFFTSTAFCFFSVDYLYGFTKKIRWIVLVLSFFNPFLVIQANFISSDSLFTSLTVFWFTFLLWSTSRQSWLAVLLQLVFLYLAFQVRYNALFYPVIALVAFAAGNTKLIYKIVSVAAVACVILVSVQATTNTNEKEAGTRVFSGFSGWQMANNALFLYKHISIDTNDLPSVEAKMINKFVEHFIDSVPNNDKDEIGSVYIWSQKSPLKTYTYYSGHMMHEKYFRAWLRVAPQMNEYGWYIVKTYPLQFLKYFILPNIRHYFWPPLEYYANYSLDDKPIPKETKYWFNLNIDHLYCTFPNLQLRLMSVYPFIWLLLNVASLLAIALFLYVLIFKRKKIPGGVKIAAITWSTFFIVNMAFSIFVSVVVIRYLSPVFILGFVIFPILCASVSPLIKRRTPF